MNYSTKLNFSGLLFASLLAFGTKAQTYCDVSTAISYKAEMPGITNFTLNTINRNSAHLECTHPCNSFVQTGLSTTLEKGKSYSVSITHSDDAATFPGGTYDMRIWIDYNHNGKLDDIGETVINIDHKPAGVTTGTFIVSANATLGNTKMRLTAKMDENEGHIPPTPCDIPADPIQYHGEIEDYTVNIVAAAGINEMENMFNISVFPNPLSDASTISFTLNKNAKVSLEAFNILGAKVATLLSGETQNSGEHNYQIGKEIFKTNGYYIIKLTIDGNAYTKNLVY